jgi:hypothetical protein
MVTFLICAVSSKGHATRMRAAAIGAAESVAPDVAGGLDDQAELGQLLVLG